ncbi:MAG TPA: MFS transporter [Desulfuromonadaceae bacterium]
MLRHLLRALRSRNYRLFVCGQGVSLVGTWMQQVAMSWLVYRLTGSALLLGVVGFTGHIPVFLLAPVAGVLADRWDRRRLLLVTQSMAMLQAALLALVVLTGAVQVWHIIVLSLALGVVSAFDIPIRQSFVVEMVAHREDLGNAIALNSSMVHSARLIGPSIAGLLVAAVGEGACFALNSASYLGVICALAAMRVDPTEREHGERHVLRELKEGFHYAFQFTPIRNILLLVATVSLLGISYTALLPVFAREVHHGGARTFGFLMAAAGGGALVGTLFLACRRSVLGLGRVMARAPALLGCGIAVFALAGSLPLAMAALMVAGFGAMTLVASSNTVLQTIVDEDKRGRVMSFYTMSFMGMSPFGSLLTGSLASAIGVRDTVLLWAAACLAGSALFSRGLPEIREKVRPIYQRMGIIRDVA